MNRKSAIVLALLCATLLVAPRSRAQAQPPPQPVTGSSTAAPPPLKSELQPLAFSWGSGIATGNSLRQRNRSRRTIGIAPDLDGSWLVFRWDDKAPNRFHAVEFWGYNKAAKHFSNFVYDNFGGARLFESKGWDADTLTWSGDMLSPPSGAEAQLNQRFVLERKSPKEFVISYDTHKPQADWSTMDRLTCKQ